MNVAVIHRVTDELGLRECSAQHGWRGMAWRAFPFIGSRDSFVPMDDALTNVDWRAEMVEKFRRDADAFAARWKSHKLVADAYAEWVTSQAKKAS